MTGTLRALDDRILRRTFKRNDLTRTIPAWNLPDPVTMNDFSSEKKFLLNSSKEWSMKMRLVSGYSKVTFWADGCSLWDELSLRMSGAGYSLVCKLVYWWDCPSHLAHSSIAMSCLTLYLTIFLATLRVKSGSSTMTEEPNIAYVVNTIITITSKILNLTYES